MGVIDQKAATVVDTPQNWEVLSIVGQKVIQGEWKEGQDPKIETLQYVDDIYIVGCPSALVVSQ